jgi:DNA-binding MarR family transcriptional regulator
MPTVTPERPATPRAGPEEVRLARLVLSILPRIGRLASQVAHERGALTLERARVLWQLTEGPRRSGDLAHRCVLTPATLSELVDSLERDGFVRRSEEPGDRRVVVVELTARGRREIERFGELMTALVAKVLVTLSSEKRGRVAAALTDLQQALSQAADKEASHVR